MSDAPSLYRRHRPRSFADVVGQEHVVRTLRNAVQQGKVHHAYLFVGSRGTGKTSMAKILAACLNCERGPTVEPCGTCASCQAIANATSLDVIEMDAASNNSVDDIRELRERVAYAPVSGRSKVYILDEAHMLSSQAWNAFLKTLEEPPPNTIFVLATTDAQKVLPTVVDRCHRFDFARPTIDQIATVLRRAADAEGIALPDAAAGLIARAATGSFRDALGTLEQLVTYGGAQIALEDVMAVLGVTDAELLFEAVDAVAAGDARAALLVVGRLADSGRDAMGFLRDLEAHARELLVVGMLGEVPAELRLTAERDERLAAQAARVAGADVVRLLDALAAALEAIKAGADPRVQLELALVKAAVPASEASLQALMARIERLEARLAVGGRPAAADPGVSAPPTSAPSTPAPSTPAPSTPERSTEPQPVAPPPAPAQLVADQPPPAAAAQAPAAASAQSPPKAAAQSPPDAPPVELDLERIQRLWPAVVENVAAENAMLSAILARARPVRCAGHDLTLAFPESAEFLKRKAESQASRQALTAAIDAVAGTRVAVAYELREDRVGQAVGEDDVSLSGEEWVQRFMTAFDAEEIEPDAH